MFRGYRPHDLGPLRHVARDHCVMLLHDLMGPLRQEKSALEQKIMIYFREYIGNQKGCVNKYHM